MAHDVGAKGFAAFREAVYDDYVLMSWLQAPLELEAYVVRVVAVGAQRGFVFAAEDVRAALRDGERAWLMQGCETA